MEIARNIFDFFEISGLSESSTFVDLIQYILMIGVSVWCVLFVCKCMFLACTFGERSFF